MSSKMKIVRQVNDLMDLLLKKNEKYGDSALNPVNVFGKQTPVDGICQRIDDKLKRIANGGFRDNIDTVKDLAGYLMLLLIAIEEEKTGSQTELEFNQPTTTGGVEFNNSPISATISKELLMDNVIFTNKK